MIITERSPASVATPITPLFCCQQSNEKKSYCDVMADPDPVAPTTPGPAHVLVAATGSVASIKLKDVVGEIIKSLGNDTAIRIVSTTAASHFFNAEDVITAGAEPPVLTDAHEWAAWTRMGDPVLHIQLRNWAHVLVAAPMDANTLAKAATGICDNLLTCIFRAWDQTKPVIICPAMNTHMWTHPFTAKHIQIVVNELGYTVVSPVAKRLACNDIGMGAMAAPADIALAVANALGRRDALTSQNV